MEEASSRSRSQCAAGGCCFSFHVAVKDSEVKKKKDGGVKASVRFKGSVRACVCWIVKQFEADLCLDDFCDFLKAPIQQVWPPHTEIGRLCKGEEVSRI